MLGNHFRPWGQLAWIFNKIQNKKWSLLGCLSTEERCLASFHLIKAYDHLGNLFFLQINDPPSKFTKITSEILEKRRRDFISLGGKTSEIEEHELFENYNKLVDSIEQFIKKSTGNIIMDISYFPKRFFFPIVRLLMRSSEIENLIITYTVPEKYSQNDLAEDPQTWLPLPLFGPQKFPEPEVKVALVGVGFIAFGLPELLRNEYSKASVKLFFPFPPGPPTYQRTWEFVRQIEKYFPLQSSNQIIRVGALDVSTTFSHICNETSDGTKNAIFAPYGPKPISLAMCVYASLTNSPVYYTQPKTYNPDYCTGIKYINGIPEIYGYSLRLGGRNFYFI